MADVLKKKDFQKLLDDTVDALQDVLKKAEETPPEGTEALAKADPGKETPAEKKPSGDSAEGSAPEKKEESKEPPKEEKEEAPEASASASDEGSDEAAPPAEGEAPPEVPAEGAEQAPADPAAAMGEVSAESLQAEYEGMPLDQQKMHLLALKAAMMKAMMTQEMAPPAAPAQTAPAATPPVAPPAAAPVAPPQENVPPLVQKTESDPAVIAKLETLEKSVESLQKSVKEKEEIISNFNKAVEGLKGVIVSQRKAVTSVSSLAKSEPASGIDLSKITKEQVTRKLSEVALAGNLKKSDRDLIVSFTVGTEKDVNKVAHLLK